MVWRNYIQIHTGVLGLLIVMLLLFLPHGLISLRPAIPLAAGQACLRSFASKTYPGISADCRRCVTSRSPCLEGRGARSLMGPNGAGKPTLVNTICGVTPANAGTVSFNGQGHHADQDLSGGAARAIAEPSRSYSRFAEFTALDNVAAASRCSRSPERRSSRVPGARGTSGGNISSIVGLDAASRIILPRRLTRWRCASGWNFAKALAMNPKLLFLDEVNAGLNSAEVGRATKLIHALPAGGITIVMIEHLMKVVLNVSPASPCCTMAP